MRDTQLGWGHKLHPLGCLGYWEREHPGGARDGRGSLAEDIGGMAETQAGRYKSVLCIWNTSRVILLGLRCAKGAQSQVQSLTI